MLYILCISIYSLWLTQKGTTIQINFQVWQSAEKKKFRY